MLYVIYVMPKSSEIDLGNFPIRCTTVAMGTSKGFQLKVQKGKVHHSTQLIMNLLIGPETSVHYPYERSCVTKFIRIQPEASAAKQSETLKQALKELEESINDTASTKVDTDGKT